MTRLKNIPAGRLAFILGLGPLILLFSCSDKSITAERETETRGIKIKIMATSSRKWDAGITGAPHTPLIIPYAGFDRSWGITLMPEGYDTLTVESFENYEGQLGKSKLEDTLNKITLAFSADRQHLLYARKTEGSEIKKLLHFFPNKKGFITSLAGFESDLQNPPDNLPSSTEIAKEIMNDHFDRLADPYAFWDAVRKQDPEGELDFLALEQFDKIAMARYLVEHRCAEWQTRSSKWKASVRKKLFDILATYENPYRRDPLNYYSIRSIIRDARDAEMDKAFIAYLLKDFSSGGFEEELQELFSDSARAGRKIELQKVVASNCRALMASQKAADIFLLFRLSKISGNIEMQEMAERRIYSRWIENEDARSFIENNFESFSSSMRELTLTMAEKQLMKKDSIDARNLLEQFGDCEKLKSIARRHPGKIKIRESCL